MIPVSKTVANGKDIVEEIERRSGQQVAACYQCGTCTSTCTGAFTFDYPPHMILRLLQLGMVDEVLASRTGSLCFDCMTCSSRCPVGIDVAIVIETAKNLADEQGIKEKESALHLFRELFLRNVQRHGRLHEGSLLAWFNLRSGKLLNDLSLIPLTLKKKKVHVMPPRIRNRSIIKKMFKEGERFPRLR